MISESVANRDKGHEGPLQLCKCRSWPDEVHRRPVSRVAHREFWQRSCNDKNRHFFLV